LCGAGVLQNAAKQRKHEAVGSPEVELADLLAGQHHSGAAADVKNAYNYNRKTGYAWDLETRDGRP